MYVMLRVDLCVCVDWFQVPQGFARAALLRAAAFHHTRGARVERTPLLGYLNTHTHTHTQCEE